MSTDLFYAPAEHALEAETELSVEPGPSSMGDAAAKLDLDEAFDVAQTTKIILEGGYKTIALQFPDELLPSSVAVYRSIQRRLRAGGAPDPQCYVVADSTYGSCCPDVLSCLHLPADLLIHYGHACLTPTDALPVHYVFPRRSLDVEAAAQTLQETSSDEFDFNGKKGIVVSWDVAYDWLADDIVRTFTEVADVPVSFATIRRPPVPTKATAEPVQQESACCRTQQTQTSSCCQGQQQCSSPSCCQEQQQSSCGQGQQTACCQGQQQSSSCSTPLSHKPASTKAPALRVIQAPSGVDLSECVIWYLGEDSRSLINLQMTHAGHPFYAYSPESGARAIHPGSSRLLSKRLFAVHSAMAADVFGLVVGNIGLASSKPLVAELREALKRAGKKSYTMSVGRLNPAKLANFAEIECFVLIGCAEGGIVDSRDFLRPVITPYELTTALQGHSHVWDPSQWTLDLGTVLDKAHALGHDEEEPNEDDDELHFDLTTGTYRPRRTFGKDVQDEQKLVEGTKDLTLRDQNFSLSKLESAGSVFLQSRSFQGLEPRYGMDKPVVLEQGRSGIARGYTEEKGRPH